VLTLSGNPDLAATVGEEYSNSGYPGVLRSWLEGLKEVSKRGYVSSYNMAEIYARLEQRQEALSALERAYTERDSNLTNMKIEPAFDGVRSDPRFRELLLRLGM
jgi:adenylate cyclase